MKRLIGIITAFALLFTTAVYVQAQTDESAVTGLLAELNIMQGDPSGNLRLNDYISRAEFIKAAVAASPYRNAVATNLNISPFKDVSYDHWAAPYIKLAVTSGIATGYPDGTFRPEGTVLYEEAVTILLRVLGYTDADFGISWPYGQVGLANNLDITKNVAKNVGDPLTRGDVATMLYNTLDANMKGKNVKLITDFDCQIIENVTLIATNREDSSVGSNKVYTTAGTFEIQSSFDFDAVGRKGDLAVKNGDTVLSFSPDEQIVQTYSVTNVIGTDLMLDGQIIDFDENLKIYYKSQTITYGAAAAVAKKGDRFVTYQTHSGVVDYAVLIVDHAVNIPTDNALEQYVVYSKTDSMVIGYQNGRLAEIDVNGTAIAYKDNIPTSYAALKTELSMGDILYVKRDGKGEIEYLSYEKGKLEGPITVTSNAWSTEFDMSSITSVMRDGVAVSADKIELNDVLYYSEDLHMIMAYSDKATGIYEKALPNKDTPEQIVLSGVTYKIESVEAFRKLSSGGEFALGDTITVLLGKDGQIADVMETNQSSETVYGYLIGTGTKTYQNADNTSYTRYILRVVRPDGKTYEYITNTDHDDLVNSVVQVDFDNGIAKPSLLKTKPGISGTFDWDAKKIGSYSLSSELKILDVTPLNNSYSSVYTTVFPQRVDGIRFDSSSVCAAEYDSKGVIKALILDNVTGDAYQYGVIISAESMSVPGSVSGSYKYNVQGNYGVYVSSGSAFTGVKNGQPARFSFDAVGGINTLTALDQVGTATSDKLDYTSITIAGKKYTLSDKVTIYCYKSSSEDDYLTLSLNDVIKGETEYTLTAYRDKSEDRCGRIRIIMATEKK